MREHEQNPLEGVGLFRSSASPGLVCSSRRLAEFRSSVGSSACAAELRIDAGEMMMVTTISSWTGTRSPVREQTRSLSEVWSALIASLWAVRRLVLELTDDEYQRIERAAIGNPTPDYIRAVLAAVLDYRETETEPDADRDR
jgi:hypothetical protein